MNYTEILNLNRALPELPLPPANRREGRRESLPAGILSYEDWRHFEYSYNDPTFGWRAVDTLVKSGRPDFPVYPDAVHKWLYRAWILQKFGDQYRHDRSLDPVRQAINIFSDHRGHTRHVLEAMLITHEAPPKQLATHLGIDGEVVEAYDALFYNVYDRKQDFLFLRNVVYPNTRMEELLEEYLLKGNLGTQLLRIGYNKKLINVLYYAGFRTDLAGELTTRAATELFRHTVMMNGHLLAENGFLNFSKQHAAISSARAILQSGLIGGTDTGGPIETTTLTGAIQGEMDRISGKMQAAADQLSTKLQATIRQEAGL